MVHKQWQIVVTLDALAHDENTLQRLINVAEAEFRNRLWREGLADGINVSEIKGSTPVTVKESGMRPQLPPPNLKIVVEGGCVQDVEGDFEFTYEVEDRDNPACFCQHCGVAVDGQHFHNCQAYKIESERI